MKKENKMATIWITYAWADNQSGDVDFIAQELVASGLKVKKLSLTDGISKLVYDFGIRSNNSYKVHRSVMRGCL